MKNLSLLFLALAASQIEAANSDWSAAARGGARGGKKTPSLANISDADSSTVVNRQPSKTVRPLDSSAEGQPSYPLLKPLDATRTEPKKNENSFPSRLTPSQQDPKDSSSFHRVIISHQEWNEGRADTQQRRFKNTEEISPALQKNRAASIKNLIDPSVFTDINARLEMIPPVRPADETQELKQIFKPTLDCLKIYVQTLPLFNQAKTKEQKIAVFRSKPALSDKILAKMSVQLDPYASFTESARTVLNCGKSIIEGSPLSTLDATYVNRSLCTADKIALLEAKRITEFTALLAQLGSFDKARTLEAESQARLNDLEAKASALEIKLLHPASETDRIETERALLGITREKAGILGQLHGAKKDRNRKNNAIVVARTETGDVRAWLGALGAKTADYVSNPLETPLMVDELFSKVLPHLSKEEKRKQAATFLEILMGRTKASSTGRLTWTDQKSIKMTRYPEFSCIVDGKDLSGKKGTEREILLVGLEQQPLIKGHAPSLALIELYKKRASLIPSEATSILHSKTPYTTVPTLEALHTQALTKSHWVFLGKNGWRQKQPAALAAAAAAPSSEPATA